MPAGGFKVAHFPGKGYFLNLLIVIATGFQIATAQSGQVNLMSHKYDSTLWEIADLIYNLEHEKAEEEIKKVKPALESHPIYDFLVSLNIVWQTIPEVVPRDFEKLEFHLNSAIQKSELRLEKNKNDPEGLLFGVLAHGLLAQYYSIQNQSFKAIGEAKKAYSAVIKGFDYVDVYNEFLFSTGLYNYYRERYPQIYPVYKPIAWIFRKGDVEAGIRQLERAITETTLSRIEAVNYLAYIYVRYEDNPADAIRILKPVIKRYPANLYFKTLYLEGKMFAGGIEKDETLVSELINSSREYYQMYGYAFRGTIFANSVDYDNAIYHYAKSLQIGKEFELVGFGAKSFSHTGLARIYDKKGYTDLAVLHYEKVLEYAIHPNLKDEAREYIKNH